MPLRFLHFPAEIREQIYKELLCTENSRAAADDPDEPADYRYHLGILAVSQQVKLEAEKIFQDNVFVKITTPWAEAINHIRREGKVPTVTTGDKAAAFKDFHLWVFIDTPSLPYPHREGESSMLICLEDLEAFTRMWHLSNLNHFGLNQHLRLKLTVQDPHVPDHKIPKPLQSRLLLPFGVVKDLHEFSIVGPKLLPSVQEALNKERAIPDPTPDESLAKGFALHQEGEQLLNAGKPQVALTKYTDSFAAIHITVSGRTRIIHAEGYYMRELEAPGKYKGWQAHYVRMVLRVQLVASVIIAYMKMEDWVEAYFWGKRSILLLRSGTTGNQSEDLSDLDSQTWFTEQTWAAGFPARKEMGQIFFQTAIASRKLDKTAGVKMLIKAAAVYLPDDEDVKKEWEITERGW